METKLRVFIGTAYNQCIEMARKLECLHSERTKSEMWNKKSRQNCKVYAEFPDGFGLTSNHWASAFFNKLGIVLENFIDTIRITKPTLGKI